MKALLSFVLLVALVSPSCHSIGVEISPEELEQAIGWTEAELEERYGTPHQSSKDSEGVTTIGYGVEHRYGMGLDATTYVEFTLEDGRVTKTKEIFSRPIANKNRARR